MPFSAKIDEETFLSINTTDEEWERIRAASKSGNLTMAWSGLPAVARTSKLGLRHFAHKRGVAIDNPLFSGESPQHLALKAKVIQFAIALGWTAHTEVPAPNREWIADTLLTSPDGSRKVAIEIQWSRQGSEEYGRRQKRYSDWGVECLWLCRYDELSYSSNIPRAVVMFPADVLTDDDPGFMLYGNEQKYALPMGQIVADFLSGEYYCGEDITFGEFECWKCRNNFIGYVGSSKMQWGKNKQFLNHPLLEKAKQEAYETQPSWNGIPIGYYEMRYSNTVEDEYMALCCPTCHSLQGDYFLWKEIIYGHMIGFLLPGTGEEWGYWKVKHQ